MASAPAKYDMAVYPMTMAVRSASDGAKVHTVQLPFCDCADFTNRKGQLAEVGGLPTVSVCKHIAAAMERVGGWHREPAPEVHSDQPRQRAVSLLTREAGMTAVTAIGHLSDLSQRRTEKAEFTGRKRAGFVTYNPLHSVYEVTFTS